MSFVNAKKRWLYCFVVFCILFMIFGYVVKQTYVHSLPVVKIEKSIQGVITDSLSVIGRISFREKRNLYIPQNCRIEECSILKGQDIFSGFPLAQLNVSDLEREKLRLTYLAEQLALQPINSPSYSALNELEVAQLHENIQEIDHIIQRGGTLISPVTGGISESTLLSGNITSTSDKLIYYENLAMIEKDPFSKEDEYADITTNAVLIWEIPFSNTEYSQYTANLSLRNGENDIYPLEHIFNTSIYEKQVVRYTADISSIPGLQVHDGQLIEVELLYTSKEYTDILPVSAVHIIENKSYIYFLKQRETTYGIEPYVEKKIITVLDRGDGYVALSGISGESIVVHSDRELIDLEAVRVI
ncbi:MAG: hypothetical protein HFE44_14995 [Oscillospiraceae bacterium]|nr:hypothetical protein [Oscillospiraceae bacterium]